VVDLLQPQGHRVHALTLTGVDDRAHMRSPDIHLSTHVQDVVAPIDNEELQDVVLVVHSYAGMVGTGVADRIAERLRHMVYVAAVVPKPGAAWSATHASATREARINAARANRLQTSMNLAIGSALASIGLTIPVVVAAAVVFNLPLELGLEAKDMALLTLTFVVSAITLGSGRTNLMQGAVHLVIFAAFLFLTLVP